MFKKNEGTKKISIQTLLTGYEETFSDTPLGDGGLFAEIILPLALPKIYTYTIPEIFADKIKPGCREVSLVAMLETVSVFLLMSSS